MSIEARNAHLRAIWDYQHSLNTTRAALLSKISDAEHFRFVTMLPLPLANEDEVEALARPPGEILEEMRSEGIGSGGWDARDGPSGSGGYQAESETDDEFLDGSDESDYFTDSSGEEDEGSEGNVGEDVEVMTVFLGDDVCQDQDGDVCMGKEDEDSEVETCESDDSAGSSQSTEPSSPEDDCHIFTHHSKDPDQTEFESPTSPPSSNYSDSNAGSDTENLSITPNGPKIDEQDQHPEEPHSTTIPPFTFEALDAPATTAEVLFAFEAAYTDVYNAGAYVWFFSRVLEDRRYEAFRVGCHRRKEEVGRRGGSKLRNEVLMEDLEWGWGGVEARVWW